MFPQSRFWSEFVAIVCYGDAPTRNGERVSKIARIAYLTALGPVWPLDGAVAVVSGEIMALLPEPPTPPRRSHHLTESRQERLARWRFDGMIAATALVAQMPLIHNNAADFEAVRSAIERSPARFPYLGPAGTDPMRFPGVRPPKSPCARPELLPILKLHASSGRQLVSILVLV